MSKLFFGNVFVWVIRPLLDYRSHEKIDENIHIQIMDENGLFVDEDENLKIKI
jgi:hypothetical protein